MEKLPETGYVRLNTILKIFPLSRSTWWGGVKSGRYPKPVKLGPAITAWRVEDIRALIQRLNDEAENRHIASKATKKDPIKGECDLCGKDTNNKTWSKLRAAYYKGRKILICTQCYNSAHKMGIRWMEDKDGAVLFYGDEDHESDFARFLARRLEARTKQTGKK